MSENETKYPLLSAIDSPADLRRLSEDQLPAVCRDMRRFLIDSLSKNPGHFASSMGAVELTVALHYVLDTPNDLIVWDVGHQAYGHKLLTGRRDRFAGNRKLNGLSGFPNPDESPYDTFSAGHASNSISAALGMAVATELNGDNPRRIVTAVIGDASIAGGLAFEGINNAASTPNNLLIVLNDNNWSIDQNVGSMHRYLARVTSSKGYNRLRFKAFKFFKKLGLVSESGRGRIMRLNNSLKAFLSRQQNIFEGLNVRYFGPVDGHDIATLVKTLRDIKDMTGPKILHVKTVKGKGFAPAEADPSTWHAPGKFDPVTGERSDSAAPEAADNATGEPQKKPARFQNVFGETLLELAREDRRIVGITAAMLSGTSVSILKKAIPERVFDVGISEEHAVTFAGGLAREGLRPVVAIYSSFLQRAYDQIINDVSLQRLPVLFCIDRAGLVGEDGATHHGVFDLTYLRAIPGMTVAAPRDARELRDIMHHALTTTPAGPFAIRYPRGTVPETEWHTPFGAVTPGKAVTLEDTEDAVAAILATGESSNDALKAAQLLGNQGIRTAVIHFPFVKPLDTAVIDSIAARGIPVVTVEDGSRIGGFGSAVAEHLADTSAQVPLRRLGLPDSFVAQGTVAELKALCGIDADGIARTVTELVPVHSPAIP